MNNTRILILITALVAVVFGVVIGVLAGYFGRGSCDGQCSQDDLFNILNQDADNAITQKLIEEIKAENIDRILEEWTKVPHLAGTSADLETATILSETWKQQGLDPVHISSYDVLLSYPDKDDPNLIYLKDENNQNIHVSQKIEKILTPDQNHSDVVPPFNAYSAPGDIEGPLVYVNYARIEDFKYLEKQGYFLNGTVAIARYGKIFRGDKVKHAQQFGCQGIILYTDPADYAIDSAQVVYPDSWWLPSTGVQRGTVFFGDGDALTPGYPAIKSAYRIQERDSDLPKILSHPIGYGDAEIFLRNMTGEEVPENWRGALSITYRFGIGFTNPNWKIKMHITTANMNRTTYNVFGYLKGTIEPDRYVLLGNHRDAWVFGAADPTGATAVMIELSRAMGLLYKQGWRPRRTIIFCSWGSEEFGMIGSYEWTEHFQKTLGERAVAYLNVDIPVMGNYILRANGVPLLYDALYKVAKMIPNPDPSEIAAGRDTIFKTWLHRFPSSHDPELPHIGSLGSGSDYVGFVRRLGIPAVDVRYTYNTKEWKLSSYPLYHSVYETYHLISNYMDSKFTYSQAVARFWGEMARYLSDSLILPVDTTRYPKKLQILATEIQSRYGNLLKTQHISLDDLFAAIQEMSQAAEKIEARKANVNKNNPLECRMYNDQMIQLERAFTDAAGVPGRSLYKHLIFAPSQHDAYAAASFPGLVDLMFEIEDSADSAQRWQQVKHHLSVLVFTIRSAASTLKPVTEFSQFNY